MNHDDAIKAIRAQGGTDEDVIAYLKSVGAKEIGADHPAHPDYKAALRRASNAVDQANAEVSDHPLLSSVAEAASTPLAGVPGGSLLMSGARKLTTERRVPFSEIQGQVNRETSDTPASALGRAIGTIAASSIMPKGGIAGGATFGGAEGLLNNSDDPTDVASRLGKGAIGAGIGGTMGGLVSGGTALARTYAPRLLGGTKTLGQNVVDREAARSAATKPLYDAAEAEGNAAYDPNAGGVRDLSAFRRVAGLLDNPKIKPFANEVRQAEKFAGPIPNGQIGGAAIGSPNDATTLREAYKLMGERQRALDSKLLNAADFPAGVSLAKSDLDILKSKLADAADPIMPSFRPANEAFAEHSAGIKDVQGASDAARRILGNVKVAGKKLGSASKEAFLGDVAEMGPEEARNATEGVLGRAKQMTLRQTATRAPALLRALDQRSGQQLPNALQRALIAMGVSPIGQDEEQP